MLVIHIYIADDDEDDRMFIREAIHHIVPDAKITEAVNGDDLLQKLSIGDLAGILNMILLDMNMPMRNGLETMAEIKSDVRYQTIPTIMISTTEDNKLKQQAYHLGAESFITKPSTMEAYKEIAAGLMKVYAKSPR